jgi:sulfate permease, SulP family
MRQQIARRGESVRFDLFAALTVAMVGTPQCMAYAAVAGVAPVFGLYTGIVPTIVGSLFGSSTYLITGPSNATSLVTANVLQPLAGQGVYLQAVFALAILAGAIKLILGSLRLGWIIRYVSSSVLMGFLAGASTLIVLGQICNAAGAPKAQGANAIIVLQNTLLNLPQGSIYAVVTSTGTMLLLLAFKRLRPGLPAELLAIVIATSFVYLAGWASKGVQLVGTQGSLSNAALQFHVPALSLSQWQSLLSSAGAVAIFSLVEAMSIAQAVSASSGKRIDPTREFIGQGLASIAGGFFQSIPSSGSPSRTAVNFSSGAHSRLAGVMSGLIVLAGLVMLGPLMNAIPIPSLAGVIIVTAYNLVNRRQLVQAWQSSVTSRAVIAATFAGTMLLPLHIAIYLGAILSIGLYVLESSKLQLSYLSQNPQGEFVEHSLGDILSNPPAIAIINIEGSLSFGAAAELEQKIEDVVRSGVHVVILRVRRLRLMGSEGVAALETVVTNANRAGTRVLICGVRDEMEATLHSSGIDDVIGQGGIFRASDVLFASTQQALSRAQDIVLQEKGHGD